MAARTRKRVSTLLEILLIEPKGLMAFVKRKVSTLLEILHMERCRRVVPYFGLRVSTLLEILHKKPYLSAVCLVKVRGFNPS